MYKFLKTSEGLQSKENLKKHLEKLASDNTLTKNSSPDTYPIERLESNLTYIYLVYTLLNDHIKLKIPIHPAGEWLLDNYYIIEKTGKTIKKDLKLKDYKELPGLLENGYARVYVLANEIVSNTDGKITKDDLIEYLNAYQVNKELTMKEIWMINTFLQISLIEKIREICEKIFIAQSQKWKVENIIERLIKNKDIEKIDIPISGEYQFIEYMSYKLRMLGKEANSYEVAFEEQVEKSGITIEKAINREHYDIAIKTLSIKNSITSIKTTLRMDTISVFEQTNFVEKILNKDPADVYRKMDYSSKAYYRSKILEIAKKTNISEIFIANKIIELCKRNGFKTSNEFENNYEGKVVENQLQTINNQENKEISLKTLNDYSSKKNNYLMNSNLETTNNVKKLHVGYYLIDNGKEELISEIRKKKVKLKTSEEKTRIYISIQIIFTIILSFLLSLKIKFFALFLVIPILNMFNKIANYILSKIIKPKLIPKIDLEKGIPDNLKTVCIIPVILNNEKKVDEIFKKLEVYYLANKSENLYFTLLGDCKESIYPKVKQDELIIKEGMKKSKELNKKYGEKFFFIYRKRVWNESEQKYIGWERKRGAITEFNEFLINNRNKFEADSCEDFFVKNKIKYVITIDEDTNLILDSAKKLVGTMTHILNTPEISKVKDRVVSGHGIIQPRIEIDMEDARINKFTSIFTECQGLDIYTNIISNFYQDNFDEGIYTGKGIYDVEIFNKVLKNQIPENKVLSHDLLEGSFLRAGYASDIELIDSYPSNYISYKKRKHRWIRGDMQICSFIKSNLNLLSKYKIIDNVIRNFNEIFIMLSLVLSFILQNECLSFFTILIFAFPYILKLIDNVRLSNLELKRTKTFAKQYSNVEIIFFKFFISLITLIDIATLQLDAIIRSIYRMKVSHQKLLEWTTSSEEEEKGKSKVDAYYRSMAVQVMASLILVAFLFSLSKINLIYWTLQVILIIMWITAPYVMYKLCKKNKVKNEISYSKEKELLEIAKNTWKFFKDNMVNFLPIDNFQEDRKEKRAYHTSPTNIGFLLMAVISSYDLKFESKEDTINLIKNIISSIEKLEKWNGHLYNWYNVKTLKPIQPLDVSSVDSGNFVGYLITTKEFLIEQKADKNLINQVNNLIEKTDFSKLYDKDMGLFSIGFNVKENKLYDSYYDLLASEARQASIIAIAKKDVPEKHWKNLGRTLTKIDGYKGLLSWGGTAFEYLMPNINIKSYDLSLLDESCRLLILSEQKYAKKLSIPWGMSEASFGQKDLKGNYQYKTFGIPWLGLKRGLADEIVVSPYSTFLSLQYEKNCNTKEHRNLNLESGNNFETEVAHTKDDNVKEDSVFYNLHKLKEEGAYGYYGFYDSIDYKMQKKVIKTYMAHHQGMILASINNYINDNIFQKRFMNDASIQGIKVLLQEKVPENIVIKEKQDKVKKIKYQGYEEVRKRNKGVNVISSDNLSNVVTSDGKSFTKLNDIFISNSEKTFIKNIASNKVYEIESEDSKYEFLPYKSKITKEDGNLKIEKETTIVPLTKIEVNKIKIQNKELQNVNLEITEYEEPILSTQKQYESHKTFDKMFLRFGFDNNIFSVTRKKRMENEPIVFEKIAFIGENNNYDFELAKENFVTRKNEKIPEAVLNSKILSNKIEIEINPIIALRKSISIEPGEEKVIYLVKSINFSNEEAEQNLMEYLNVEKLNSVFELSKEETEAENRYMNLNSKEIESYQEIIDNIFKVEKTKANCELDLRVNNLWKYGISGDYNIITVKVKDYNDIESLKNILKAYKYLKYKNIDIEVAILTNIDISGIIAELKLENFVNQRKGIFILNKIPVSDKKIILASSTVVIN